VARHEELTLSAWPEEALRQVGGSIMPDLMLEISERGTEGKRIWFVECDAGTEAARVLRTKAAAYERAVGGELFSSHDWSVLWIAPDASRVRAIATALGGGAHWVVDLSALTPDTVLRPVLRSVDGASGSLIHGLRNHDPVVPRSESGHGTRPLSEQTKTSCPNDDNRPTTPKLSDETVRTARTPSQDTEGHLTTRPEPVWVSTREAAHALGLARCTLDAMVARAPEDLPGAPVLAGAGRRRRRWRWNRDMLREWLAAFTAWDRAAPSRPVNATVRRPRKKIATAGPVNWAKAGKGGD
jgi:hypothetical protein